MPWLYAAWIACQALDTTSTALALHRGSFHEGNPFLPVDARAIVAVKVTVNLGAAAFQPHTTGRVRYVLPLTLAGTECAAGVWNLTQLTKGHP